LPNVDLHRLWPDFSDFSDFSEKTPHLQPVFVAAARV